MNTSTTLLLDALLARLSPSQADTLLRQLDKSLLRTSDGSRPRAAHGRRRTDSRTIHSIDNTKSQTSKDQTS